MTDALVDPARVLLEDRYELGAMLGGGTSAEVFRAHDHVLRRAVAVKLFAPTGDDPERASAPERELTALAALHHPGLVTLLDAGSVDGRTFLVMELVEGDTLAQVLAGRAVDAVTAAGAGRDVADALVHVHARGITHCDVTPGNVLVRHDGRAVLGDFGSALAAGATRATTAGTITGTPAYMAPEQVSPETAGGPVGPSSDVYALGLVVLEALTGNQEFAGAVTEAALARLLRTPDVPVLPAGLTPLLRHMTAARPEDRPSAREVRVALDAVLARVGGSGDSGDSGDAGGSGGPATGVPAVRTLAPGRPTATGHASSGVRRPVLLASAAATLAVAIGLGASWTTAPEASPTAAAMTGRPAVATLPVAGAPIVPQPAPGGPAAAPTWVTALAAAGRADRVISDPDARRGDDGEGAPSPTRRSGSASHTGRDDSPAATTAAAPTSEPGDDGADQDAHGSGDGSDADQGSDGSDGSGDGSGSGSGRDDDHDGDDHDGDGDQGDSRGDSRGRDQGRDRGLDASLISAGRQKI